jgi:hypothetical protein
MKARDLTAFESFKLWVELDASQLGMELVTYYAWCALWGVFNALVYAQSLPYWLP